MVAITQIAYPASLPSPRSAPFRPAERRALSTLPGPRNSRALSRDRLGEQPVEFIFTHDQVAIWTAWLEDTLVDAGAWFAASWPLPVGGVGVRKFVGAPSYPEYFHNVGWRVVANTEVRGRGELPVAISNPGLVAAIDFEGGLVDSASPGRTFGQTGSITYDAAKKINGASGGALNATSYFWLPTSTDFGFGTGDFGIELWSYYPNPPGGQSIDMVALNGVFNLYDNGTTQLQNQLTSGNAGSWTPTTASNAWRHHFFGRKSGVMYHGFNGSMGTALPQGLGPNANTISDVGSSAYIVFGNRNPSSSQFFSGTWFIDRVRVYKGLCPYTANYTPETGLYPR